MFFLFSESGKKIDVIGERKAKNSEHCKGEKKMKIKIEKLKIKKIKNVSNLY